MSKAKKIGIIFIILGGFIPCILYPFTKPTTQATLMQFLLSEKGASVNIRLNELEIVLKGGTIDYEGPFDTTTLKTLVLTEKLKYKGRIAIPYKYVMALGVVLVFTGAGVIALLSNKGLKE